MFFSLEVNIFNLMDIMHMAQLEYFKSTYTFWPNWNLS